jgi:hypothetical protein
MTTRAVLVAVLALCAVAGGAATASPNRQLTPQASCPTTVQAAGYQGITATAQIVAAIRRGVPRIFHDFTTQGGGPGWHHYQVAGLFSLNGGYRPEPSAIRRYRKIATHRCGRAVTSSSWVVFLQFPAAPMASADTGYMFVAKTRDGWVAW